MRLVDWDEGRGRKSSFELIGKIGEGGYGVVYLGRDDRDHLAAIKEHQPKTSVANADSTRERFSAEIEFLNGFSHPAVPRLLEASIPEQGADPWHATDYVPGPSLDKVVGRYRRLPPAAVLHLAAQLGDVLGAVHEIGTHRDVKPQNVLLTVDQAHLVDFGIARLHRAAPLTEAGLVVGSPDFIAPERIHEQSLRDPVLADVFSLGGTLLFAATGRPPFPYGTDDVHLTGRLDIPLDGVHSSIREIIRACLAVDPADRPTARAVAGWARKLITTAGLGAALDRDIADNLVRLARDVRDRARPVRRSRATTPQAPRRGNEPGWTASVGDWVQSVVAVPGRVVVVSVGGAVHTFREADGEVMGRFALPAPPTGAVAGFEDTVYIGAADGSVYVATPDTLKRIDVGGRVQGCAATPTGVVVSTGDSRVFGIDGRTAVPVWEARTAAAPGPHALAAHGTTAYVGSVAGTVHRLRLDDGAQVGRPTRIGHRIVSIAAHRTGAHVVAADGTLYRLGTDGGPPAAEEHLGHVSACRADGDLLVACTSGGTVHTQNLAAGAAAVDVPTGGTIRRSLAAGQGLVVTGRVDGSVYVLQVRDPRPRPRLWHAGSGVALDAPAAVTAGATVVAGWADGTIAAFARAG